MELSFKYYRGNMFDISIPDKPYPDKRIQKLRNILKAQQITKVLLWGLDDKGIYSAIPCGQKHKKHAIPVRVGNISLYAYSTQIVHVDVGILIQSKEYTLCNKEQVLAEIKQKLPKDQVVDQDIIRLELTESPLNKAASKPGIRTIVCPECRKLLPTDDCCVYIDGEGMPVLRVGLCMKCCAYYSSSSKVRHKKVSLGGVPVIWSGLRYQYGFGENIVFSTVPTSSLFNSAEKNSPNSNSPEDIILASEADDCLPPDTIKIPHLDIHFKQLPVTESNKCPFCKHEQNSVVEINYSVYSDKGQSHTCSGNARQCENCNCVFLDAEQIRIIKNKRGKYRIYTIDAGQFDSVPYLYEAAQCIPDAIKNLPSLDYYKKMRVISIKNLALTQLLDNYLQAYRSFYDNVLDFFSESNEDCLNDGRQKITEIIPSELYLNELNPLLLKSSWLLSPSKNCGTIQPEHLDHFSLFDPDKVDEYYRIRKKLIKNPDLRFRKSKYYAIAEEGISYILKEALVSFEKFLEKTETVFREVILCEKRRIFPNLTVYQNIEEIWNHSQVIIKERKKECLSSGAAIKQLSNQPLHLYGLLSNTKCFQHRHPLETKLYYVKKRKGAEILALPAHYCPVCNKYMMGELSFSLFGECFGNFSVQTIKGPDCKHDYSDFEGESELYRLGYSARAGKSDYERHRVLVDILESEKLSFSEIVATIEADIRRYQFHPNFVAAIPKYQNDLEFINNCAKQKLRAANAEQKE